MNNQKLKLTKVKNKLNGDIFFASNLHDRIIDGETFVGVTKDQNDVNNIRWIKRDNLVKINE